MEQRGYSFTSGHLLFPISFSDKQRIAINQTMYQCRLSLCFFMGLDYQAEIKKSINSVWCVFVVRRFIRNKSLNLSDYLALLQLGEVPM